MIPKQESNEWRIEEDDGKPPNLALSSTQLLEIKNLSPHTSPFI